MRNMVTVSTAPDWCRVGGVLEICGGGNRLASYLGIAHNPDCVFVCFPGESIQNPWVVLYANTHSIEKFNPWVCKETQNYMPTIH